VLGGRLRQHGHIPSKTLRESALHLSGGGFGQRGFREGSIEVTVNCITVADFMYRKDRVVAHEWKRIDPTAPSHGRPLRRQRRFISPTRIAIRTPSARKSSTATSFHPTGSSPHRPDNVTFDATSSAIAIHPRHRPHSGAHGRRRAGIIGVEYHRSPPRSAWKCTDRWPDLAAPNIAAIVPNPSREFQNRLGITMPSAMDVDSSSAVISRHLSR